MDLKENKKEAIQSRLKQSAARNWGYRESETEGFDPVIDMLFGACSVEFERLSTALYDSRSRILEKVAQILLPDVNLRPVPAYAVIQAKPALAERMSGVSDQFMVEKEFSNPVNHKTEVKKIFFSPASGFRLIDAEVMFLATSGEISRVNGLDKEIICRAKTKSTLHPHTLWIALKINPTVSSMQNVSFYFDWLNHPDKGYLLKLLHLSRWFVSNREVTVSYGFSKDIEEYYGSISIDMESFLDINIKTEKKVVDFFRDSYMTVLDEAKPVAVNYPEALKSFYEVDDLEKFKEKYCWIEIRFPELFPIDAFSSIFCTPNAIPVLNRKLHNSNRPFTLNTDLNILPLQTDDMFFSIRKIISSGQVSYQEVPVKKASDYAPGTYTVRTKGVQRFDERDASEQVLYLLELLREEYAAFHSMNSVAIEKELNDLKIIINRLSVNVSKSDGEKSNTHFLFMKSAVQEDVWLEFWSTSGPFANQVIRGHPCLNSDFDKKCLRLLTTSTGGKNPPDQLERTLLFKNDLLSRNRIVTVEDIRSFCRVELGNELKDVSVHRSTIMESGRNTGFRNCLVVRLMLIGKKGTEEREGIVNRVEKSLQQRSSCIYQYRVECVNE